MALNFPDNPSLNDIYEDSTSGFTYTWNGTVWISVVDRKIGNIKPVDDISASFDGTETVFDFKSNGNVISPLETNKTIVSVGGVLQNPGDDYSVFGEYITFSTPPNSGLAFFGQVLQTDQSKSTLPDGSIVPDALSTGGFSWNSSGDFVVSGILTSGTSSVTLDGDTNQITVGTAGTINQSGIDIVGIMTAGSFVGDGSNLTGIVAGIGTTGSINTSGIITASSFTGDGRNLTDIGGYLAGLIYTPGIGATDIATSTGIAITFTKSITKNTGVINLRENAIDGTIAESFDITTVGSSSTIAISGATLTLTPGTTLGAGTTYFVEVPVNSVKDTYKTGGNLGITNFTFETSSGGVLGYYMSGPANEGRMGQNDEINRSSPVQLPGTWSRMHRPAGYGQGIKTDGSLWAWGTANLGTLGINDATIQYSSPVQIPGTNWSGISGSYSNAATKTDGTMWMWGWNSYGDLGFNDAINYSSPKQLPGTNWSVEDCYTSSQNKLVLQTDGSLWVWGRNYAGVLGKNFASGFPFSFSSPSQLGSETDWNSTSMDALVAYATNTSGELYSWGYNTRGSLGQNDLVNRSSPVQIPGTQWQKVMCQMSRSATVLRTDGTLWSWGENGQGELGLNDTINYSSPIQVGSDTTWSHLNGGDDFKYATKTDGSLWGWGLNSAGQLGLGDAITRSSPVQVPGTWSITTTSGHAQFTANRIG